MRGPDPLSGLAAEFRALPAADRRTILRALSAAERGRLEALIRCVDSRPGPVPEDPNAAFSACVRERLAGAEAGEPGAWRMTPSGRRLLDEAIEELRGRRGGAKLAEPAAAASLSDALLGMLSPRRWAR